MFEQDPSLYNRIVVISFFPDILYQVSNCIMFIYFTMYTITQLKKIDSKVVVGLIIRETFFTKPPSELFNEISPDKQKIKYFFVNFFQKIVMWLLKTFVWKIIDVGLILPHKEDILKGRYVYCIQYCNVLFLDLIVNIIGRKVFMLSRGQ